jgi:hypothetical protein
MGKSLFTICLLVLAFVSCDPPGDSRLWITNPTKDSLYYYEAYERYPLPEENPFRGYDEHNFYPHERRNFGLGTGQLDDNIVYNSPTDHSILFYTFDKKLIENTPWSVIRKRKQYKLYRLNVEEIKRQNWEIILSDKYRLH